MTGPGSPPPSHVPTLTEVVAWPDAATGQAPGPHPAMEAQTLEADLVAASPSPPFVPPPPPMTDEQIVQRVMADLQHQIDLMLEYRLRETLTPLLTRAADSVVRDARNELASTLRDLVATAVAQELARHRKR